MPEETDLLKSLVRSRAGITLVIPKDADLAYLETLCKQCSTGADTFDRNGSAAKLIEASAVMFLHKRPSLWKNKYKKFEDFLGKHVYRAGFERAVFGQYKRIATKWGKFPLSRIARIPVRNMNLISKVSDQTQASAEKYLEAAESKTYEDLQQFVEGKGHSREETTSVSVKITGDLGQMRDIQRFLSDETVHAVTGTDDQATNVCAAIGEFYGSHQGSNTSVVTLIGTADQAKELQSALRGAEDPIAKVLASLKKS